MVADVFPGRSPEDLVSLLIHRAFGPLHRHAVDAVLDYHGITGQPAEHLPAVAARHSRTDRSISLYVTRVRRVAGQLPARDELAAAMRRPSGLGEDHLARTRIAHPAPATAARHEAATFGEAADPGAPSSGRPHCRRRPRRHRRAAAFRDRRRRPRRARLLSAGGPITAGDLGTALQRLGLAAPDADGRWRAREEVRPPDRYLAVLAAASTETDLTRSDVAAILVTAEYAPSGASSLLPRLHPLV